MVQSQLCPFHYRLLVFVLVFHGMLSATSDSGSDGYDDTGASLKEQSEHNQDALIEKQVQDIIELKPAGLDFYTAAAKKATKMGTAGCVLGGLAGALFAGVGMPMGCVGGSFVMSLIAAIEAPFAHWSKSTQAAYKARKAYVLSFGWLGIEAFDLIGADFAKARQIIHGRFRACAKKFHPDKLPKDISKRHRERADEKLANCRFAKAYLVAFQSKYGVVDPTDENEAGEFLRQFAGAWAATFGSNDGAGTITETQTAEWMAAIREYGDL